MKKILLATTAVVLSAGVASAELTLSGDAFMGLQYNGGTDAIAAQRGAVTAANIATARALETATGTAVAGFGAAGNTVAADLAQAALIRANAAAARTAADAAVVTAQAAVANDIALTGAVTAANQTALNTAMATAATAATTAANAAALENAINGAAAVAGTNGRTTLINRFTVNIDGSMETTSGLTFGARIRVRSNDAGAAGVSGARVYMTTGGLTLAAGNINGAIDSMPNVYQSEVGLNGNLGAGNVVTVGIDSFNATGAGSNGIELIYSAGAFSGHLSYSENNGGISGGAAGADRAAAHIAYTMGDWTVALGAQESSVIGEDLLVMTVAGKMGDYGVGFSAADNDGSTKISLNGSATFGATTVSAFVADDEAGTDTALGLGVAYDLGGASVVGGVQKDTTGRTSANMGVSFSF